jgi:hypothetical protein
MVTPPPALHPCTTFFLDDLSDIGSLESLVEQSAIVVFFITSGFFESHNARREVRATFALRRPYIVVVETSRLHGGASLAELRAECEDCTDERCAQLAPLLFGDTGIDADKVNEMKKNPIQKKDNHTSYWQVTSAVQLLGLQIKR